MPPLKDPELYYSEKAGDYIYYPSRITPLKRQLLAVEAMHFVKSGVRLIITGVGVEEEYNEQIKKTIRKNKLETRVEIRNQWITDDEKRELFANALGTIYIPFHEDLRILYLWNHSTQQNQ